MRRGVGTACDEASGHRHNSASAARPSQATRRLKIATAKVRCIWKAAQARSAACLRWQTRVGSEQTVSTRKAICLIPRALTAALRHLLPGRTMEFDELDVGFAVGRPHHDEGRLYLVQPEQPLQQRALQPRFPMHHQAEYRRKIVSWWPGR